MTRKQALAIITVEHAENGKMTQAAMRAYVENRISYKAFQQAIGDGMRIFNRSQGLPEPKQVNLLTGMTK